MFTKPFKITERKISAQPPPDFSIANNIKCKSILIHYCKGTSIKNK